MLRRIRFITYDRALAYLEERGYGSLQPFDVIVGGLLSHARLSKLFFADGLVWEFEQKDDDTRVYVYEEEELKAWHSSTK